MKSVPSSHHFRWVLGTELRSSRLLGSAFTTKLDDRLLAPSHVGMSVHSSGTSVWFLVGRQLDSVLGDSQGAFQRLFCFKLPATVTICLLHTLLSLVYIPNAGTLPDLSADILSPSCVFSSS